MSGRAHRQPERSPFNNDVSVVLFALVDLEQVRAMRPRVSPGAAILLNMIDEYPAVCRWNLLLFATLQLWDDEPHAGQAIEIAIHVHSRRRQLLAELEE